MKRNFLPEFVGISMTKSQFCFSTGCSPYRLRQVCIANEARLAKLGYHRWDKLLMPSVVGELLAITGLRIDIDYYTQYVAGQRGIRSAIASE